MNAKKRVEVVSVAQRKKEKVSLVTTNYLVCVAKKGNGFFRSSRLNFLDLVGRAEKDQRRESPWSSW